MCTLWPFGVGHVQTSIMGDPPSFAAGLRTRAISDATAGAALWAPCSRHPLAGGPYRYATRAMACPASGIARQIVHRSLRAARPIRHACSTQPHFHAAQRAHQLQIAKIAEMTDAEYAVLDLA